MMIIDHFSVSEAEQTCRDDDDGKEMCLKILGINSNKRLIKSTVSKLRNESRKKIFDRFCDYFRVYIFNAVITELQKIKN